jgi:hypothetical protein
MKEYKGLYHNVQDKTKYFEYGAHFKYSELYKALNDLLVNQLKENPTSEKEINLSTLKIENKEEVPEKKRKKYKLKTNVTKNNRYLNTDANDKEDEKNKIDVIEEEQDNIKKTHIHKKNRFMTKSLDKVNLPQISSNSLISLQNLNLLTEPKEINHLHVHQSVDLIKKKKINFPKLNSLHKHNILPENPNNHMIVETQSRFQDNGAIKIFNDSSEQSSKNKLSHKNKKDKIFPKIFHLSKENEEKIELLPRPQRKNDRLTSIFEKEKLIKNNNNNIFLGEKNNYMNREQREIMNDHMAQQIYNLKKQLLGNSSQKLKKVHQ